MTPYLPLKMSLKQDPGLLQYSRMHHVTINSLFMFLTVIIFNHESKVSKFHRVFKMILKYGDAQLPGIKKILN